MLVELINTGTELLLGQVLNSHQQWLCRRLSDLGYKVGRQLAVPDVGREIESAVRESLTRADLVITTGGLGPTSADQTRDAVSRMLGRTLREDAETVARIESLFARRKIPMPPAVRVQALVPEGARVVPNPVGTAPGLFFRLEPNPFRQDGRAARLLLLPGPGRELRPMFNDAVVPLLSRELPLDETWVSRILRTTGLGESMVQERIQNVLADLVASGLNLGYSARPGQVDVRLGARGGGAEDRVTRAEQIIRAALGSSIYGIGEEDLEQTVIRELTQRNETLATAESCTGGCIAHRLTNVPGASAVFRAGWVTYSNQAKHELLGVTTEILDRYGAVSEIVAREMAAGARKLAEADYALAVTGIAGPTGGTPAKPVGTVFIALASQEDISVRQTCNPLDRLTFKEVTAQQALNDLRLLLQKTK